MFCDQVRTRQVSSTSVFSGFHLFETEKDLTRQRAKMRRKWQFSFHTKSKGDSKTQDARKEPFCLLHPPKCCISPMFSPFFPLDLMLKAITDSVIAAGSVCVCVEFLCCGF